MIKARHHEFQQEGWEEIHKQQLSDAQREAAAKEAMKLILTEYGVTEEQARQAANNASSTMEENEKATA